MKELDLIQVTSMYIFNIVTKNHLLQYYNESQQKLIHVAWWHTRFQTKLISLREYLLSFLKEYNHRNDIHALRQKHNNWLSVKIISISCTKHFFLKTI